VLCVSGWSGSGKSTLLCYLHERHDVVRARVLLDLDDGRLAEGHRWLDELGRALARQVPGVELARYREVAAGLDRARPRFAASAVDVRIRQASLFKGSIAESAPSVQVDLTAAVAEANKDRAAHDRQARDELTAVLFDALEPFAGMEWALLVDTYERVAHAADGEFLAWFEHDFLAELADRQPGARVVVAGRERLPTGMGVVSAAPLAAWDASSSDQFLVGHRLGDANVRNAVFGHCQGHPLMTDLARQVWQAGEQTGRPLAAGDLRPHTNQAAALAWLLEKFVERLPEGMGTAVRVVGLLREVSLDALNAMLAPRQLTAPEFARLLSLSFVGQPPAPARAHDLVREVEDSWRRRQELAEYRRLHAAAFQHYYARGELVNGLYHLLAIDEEEALAAWVEAVDQARQRYDLETQSELLDLLQLPERREWLQPRTRGFLSLFSGLLSLYQRRLAESAAAFERSADEFAQADDSWGVATATRALGDLYVRTARLEETEGAYEQALPIYRAVQARLGEANTLQSLARFHSVRGEPAQAEQAFSEALDIYTSISDRYSLAATLTYRGQHRLACGDLRAGADWAGALVLAIGTEPFLARQVIALTVGETRGRCASAAADELVAAAVTALLDAAEVAAGAADLSATRRTSCGWCWRRSGQSARCVRPV
jgi:tetratricopeptide (TPR) repeat protein